MSLKSSKCTTFTEWGARGLSVVGPDLASLVDGYWQALTNVANTLEDIEGADERWEYLVALRQRLLEELQELDSVLSGGARYVSKGHQFPYVVTDGLAFLGLSGNAVVQQLVLDQPCPPADLQARLMEFGRSALEHLPGDMPEALGRQGQRQVLRAMRAWSATAEAMGEDLSFLAARFREL